MSAGCRSAAPTSLEPLSAGRRQRAPTSPAVYVVGNGYGAGTLVQAPPNLATQSSLRPGYGLVGAAVFDDSLIIGPASAPMLALRTANWDDSVVLGAKGADVSVSRRGVIASYEIYTPTLSFVDVRTGALDDTVGTSVAMSSSRDVAFAGDGVAYATAFSNSVALIDKITAATLGVGTALVGSSVRVSLTLQSGRLMDDSTVTALWLGDDTIPVTRVPGQNAVEFAAPSRIGTMAVAVELRGGNSISAGSLTITTPPPPPPTPASAPAAPVAKAGDASASVSWSAPTSSGSFPVSHYQVASSPGGRTCLVPAPSLSCSVDGLANGATYTFTVKALTGAGWSASSEPSNAVTLRAVPRPTIVITGSRAGARIAVAGRTTGMGMGGLVTPWTSRSLEGFISRAAIPVTNDGTFTWSRRASSAVVWRVYFTAEGARSNTVTIR